MSVRTTRGETRNRRPWSGRNRRQYSRYLNNNATRSSAHKSPGRNMNYSELTKNVRQAHRSWYIILKYDIFHAGSLIVYLKWLSMFSPCRSRPSSGSCPFHIVVYYFMEYRRRFSFHDVSKPSKLAFLL